MKRSKLETVILSYDLHVKNKTIPTSLNLANNTESLADYIITDSPLINDTVISDSIKSDHFATCSMSGNLVDTEKIRVQKTF